MSSPTCRDMSATFPAKPDATPATLMLRVAPPPLVRCRLHLSSNHRLLSACTSASCSPLPAPLDQRCLRLLLRCRLLSAGASTSRRAVASCRASTSRRTHLIWLVVASPLIGQRLCLPSSPSHLADFCVTSCLPVLPPLIDPPPPVAAPPPIRCTSASRRPTASPRASASSCTSLIWLVVTSHLSYIFFAGKTQSSVMEICTPTTQKSKYDA